MKLKTSSGAGSSNPGTLAMSRALDLAEARAPRPQTSTQSAESSTTPRTQRPTRAREVGTWWAARVGHAGRLHEVDAIRRFVARRRTCALRSDEYEVYDSPAASDVWCLFESEGWQLVDGRCTPRCRERPTAATCRAVLVTLFFTPVTRTSRASSRVLWCHGLDGREAWQRVAMFTADALAH
jgi:hypothetical protein